MPALSSADFTHRLYSGGLLDDRQVRLEAYLLPLIENSLFNGPRDLTGGDGAKLKATQLTPGTLALLYLHVGLWPDDKTLGDWFTIQLDDGPLFRRRVELQIRGGLNPPPDHRTEEQLFWKLPLTIGVGVRDGEAFAKQLDEDWKNSDLGDGEPKVKAYRGVDIKSVSVNKKSFLQRLSQLKMFAGQQNDWLAFLPDTEAPSVIYQALIGDGYYLSLQEESLQHLIDLEKDKKTGKKGEMEPLNASFYLAPSAAKAADAVRLYLEWETHKQALANNAEWLALHRAGVVPADATPAERDRLAFHFLGYTPVSPDGSAYRYDAAAGEMVNVRHGSYRREHLEADLDKASPLRELLRQFKSVRADLDFREHGVHATLTLDRAAKGK